MIERYSTPEMSSIWTREAKYRRWLEVELAVCQAWADVGVIPAEDFALIRSKATFDLARCDQIEAVTRHDLMAFVRNVSESISGQDALSNIGSSDPDPSRWVHFGVTSYDVIDTALGMMLRESCDVVIDAVNALNKAVEALFDREGQVACIGRTHGIHAEAITFGHKLQGWHVELTRNLNRVVACRKEVSVGKVSGAVGIHAHIDPEMEKKICSTLGLEPDRNSTQIVSRDRMANLLCTLAVLAGTLERIATELRNLQRTEIRELQEEFATGQTGSSAMPHKRNPWNSETVCGLARLVRGNAHAMLETVSTWHERDLTNSSLERVILPDTFQVVHFMILRMTKVVSGLTVDRDKMRANLRLMGDLTFSEHVMVALIKAGVSREGAYKVAQRAAAKAWEGSDFRAIVEEDPEVRRLLSKEQLSQAFDIEHHLRNAPQSLS